MPFSSLADGYGSPTIASLLVAGLRRCEGVVAAAVPPVAEEQRLPKSSMAKLYHFFCFMVMN